MEGDPGRRWPGGETALGALLLLLGLLVLVGQALELELGVRLDAGPGGRRRDRTVAGGGARGNRDLVAATPWRSR